MIESQVVARHALCGEAILEPAADPGAVELSDPGERCDCLGLGGDDEARHPVLDDLGDRAAVPGDHGGPAGHRLDHHEAEGFRPVDREQERPSASQELALLKVVHGSEIGRVGAQQGAYAAVEIIRVADIDRAAEPDRQAGRAGDADRHVGSFLVGHATHEGHMVVRHGAQLVARSVDAVMHDAGPVRSRDACRLRRRNRRHRKVGEALKEKRPVELVDPPMDGGQAAPAVLTQESRMREFAVAVDDVELVEPQAQGFQLQGVQGGRDPGSHPPVSALQSRETRVIANARQVCRTVRRSKQCYFNAQASKRRAEIMHNPLGAAMLGWGDGKYVWCNLGDADHDNLFTYVKPKRGGRFT